MRPMHTRFLLSACLLIVTTACAASDDAPPLDQTPCPPGSTRVADSALCMQNECGQISAESRSPTSDEQVPDERSPTTDPTPSRVRASASEPVRASASEPVPAASSAQRVLRSRLQRARAQSHQLTSALANAQGARDEAEKQLHQTRRELEQTRRALTTLERENAAQKHQLDRQRRGRTLVHKTLW